MTERRTSHAKTFDAQPCLGSSVADMSRAVFVVDYLQHAVAADVLEDNHRPLEQQLSSLRFFDSATGAITNVGILLFGLDVRRWLPGAYIQFLRVNGTSLADEVINDRELQGDLMAVLRELDALVDAQLAQFPVADTALTERYVEALPRVAVRELVMNAVLHRDYALTAPLRITWFNDRIEIQSPGGLYCEANPGNFPRQTSYRNPVLAEALKTLGYVNGFGRGVIRAQDALQKNGNPDAEFAFDSGYVLAVIRMRR